MLEKFFNHSKSSNSNRNSKHSIKVSDALMANVDTRKIGEQTSEKSNSSESELLDKHGPYVGPPSLDEPLELDCPWITEPLEDTSCQSTSSTSPTANDIADESSFVDEIELDCTSLSTSISKEGNSSFSDLSVIGTSAEWPISSAQMMAITFETMDQYPVDVNNNHYGLVASRNRTTSLSEGSHLNKTEKFNRGVVPWARPKPLNLNYNTNFKRPPETWLRTRHTGHTLYRHHPIVNRHNSVLYNYTYSKTSWAMYAFRYAGRGRKLFSKGFLGLNQSGCLCCGCCFCSKINQTACCCCYHCIHRASACRRPDLNRMKPTTSISRKSISSAIIPAPPTQAAPPLPIGKGQKLKPSSDDEMESGLDSGTDSPIHRRGSILTNISDDRNSLRF